MLSQFLSNHTDEHMMVEIHVLKYLKGNHGNDLFFSSSSALKLKGFSDYDWGSFPDARRSTYGIFSLEIQVGRVRNKQLL